MTTKTGQIAPVSGQWRVVGTSYEITLSRGDRVPPYERRAVTYILVDRTRVQRYQGRYLR